MLLRIYPDIHLTVEDLIAEGDKVVGRTTVTGTHRGEFMGLAPTGKSITYNEIFIFRFVDGKVAETWAWSTFSRRCGSSGWSTCKELADCPCGRLRGPFSAAPVR